MVCMFTFRAKAGTRTGRANLAKVCHKRIPSVSLQGCTSNCTRVVRITYSHAEVGTYVFKQGKYAMFMNLTLPMPTWLPYDGNASSELTYWIWVTHKKTEYGNVRSIGVKEQLSVLVARTVGYRHHHTHATHRVTSAYISWRQY